MVASKCGGIGPAPRNDSPLRVEAERVIDESRAAWEAFSPQGALEATWRLIGSTNSYLELHAPWKMNAGGQVDAVMGDALEAIRLVTILATPAMPKVCEEIWRRLGLGGSPTDELFERSAVWGLYPGDRTVEKGDPLFPRIKSDS